MPPLVRLCSNGTEGCRRPEARSLTLNLKSRCPCLSRLNAATYFFRCLELGAERLQIGPSNQFLSLPSWSVISTTSELDLNRATASCLPEGDQSKS